MRERISVPLRGLPSNITSDSKLWCITGTHRQIRNGVVISEGGGVLEWCYDEQDAKARLSELKKDNTGQYAHLSAGKYK